MSVLQVNALSGDVVLLATDGSVTGKSPAVAVRADRLAVQAGDGVGTVSSPLLVSVLDLALSAGAGSADSVGAATGAGESSGASEAGCARPDSSASS